MMDLEHAYRQAAKAILAADARLIGAGAGMGVDSGLPDFRGPEGFWRAYPAFRGRRFEEMSNPVWFQRDPEQAWGFFGQRLNLHRTNGLGPTAATLAPTAWLGSLTSARAQTLSGALPALLSLLTTRAVRI